jgi:hypothetical protein
VSSFTWLAALGKILTMDNIRKRHVIVADKCCMCKMNGKSMDLLLYCDVACTIWTAFFFFFFSFNLDYRGLCLDV